MLFHEYFHGDNGAGLGASHQTGWTGLIAALMHVFATTTPESFLAGGRLATFAGMAKRAAAPAGAAPARPVEKVPAG